jgi:glucokinase
MATIIEIVDGLAGEGLVREVGTGPSTGGRPPVLLEMVPHARSAVGLEVGTGTLTAVLTDLNAEIKHEVKMPSGMGRGPEVVARRVGEALREVMGLKGEGTGEILGVGVALPGPILASRGMVFSPPSYPGWGSLDLGKLIAEEHELPVLVDNDANAAALGEHLFGAGRGVRNMFYVIAHRGVGGAAIVDGRLYRGTDGGAGEVGHTVIDMNGPRCGCGNRGCLEAFVGRAAISRRARRAVEALEDGSTTVLGGEVKTEDVIRAGLEGDGLAREILAKTGEYLGVGISGMVNLFDPEVVVVGGSTMSAGRLVLGPAIEVVRKRALAGLRERVEVVEGELGEEAGPVGAAALVLRELFAVSVSGGRESSAGKSVEVKVSR